MSRLTNKELDAVIAYIDDAWPIQINSPRLVLLPLLKELRKLRRKHTTTLRRKRGDSK